jgi:hypothetical protein
VYESVEPGHLVRIKGQAPLGATVYEIQKLRCNLCCEIFTARTPPEVGPAKYDAESASRIALLKYGSGLPFNRLERLEGSLGIPLPAATQWEIVEPSADQVEPALDEMIRQAAQGQVVHNDDTTMKVLAQAHRSQESTGSDSPDRKGVFTSGIVSILEGHRIALFFTGHRHAGENLAAVLKHRASERDRPIQMCDALSRNRPDLPPELQTIVAHGRRPFVDVAANFPEECLHVLNLLKEVNQNDAEARNQGMSPPQRLQFHRTQSGPKMDELKTWLTAQIEERKVEPNSGLGEAIAYMLKYWQALTLFLRQPAAAVTNSKIFQACRKDTLRHTFVTNLSHAPSRVAQSLARHKSSAMTDRYTHVRLNDERAALNLLPDLTVEPNSEKARATGTDNAVVTNQESMQVRQIQSEENGARFGALRGTNRQSPVELGAKENRVDGGENAVSTWAGLESNQRHTDFQSVALPTELPTRAKSSWISLSIPRENASICLSGAAVFS